MLQIPTPVASSPRETAPKYPLQRAMEHDPLGTVIAYYASCLEQHPKALAAVERLLGMSHEQARAASVGFSDRSLGNQLPSRRIVAGVRIRTQLEELGLYKGNGRETLRGCLTIPIRDHAGRCTGIRAVRIDADSQESDALVLEFPRSAEPGNENHEIRSSDAASAVASDVAQAAAVDATLAQATVASTVPAPDYELHLAPDHVLVRRGDRDYKIRGLDKNMSSLTLRVNIQAARRDMLHLDSIDLMRSAARAAFIKATALELHCQEETIKKDLGLVLLHLDDLRNRQIEAAKATRAPLPQMPPDEARDALDLLRDPNLIGRIVRDLEHCGMVGEAFNKLAAYLAIVSRKLASPLAILVQSSSSAGKSTLMDTILAMAPPEDVIQLSNLTSQALYYLPPDALRHKTLAICEDQGLAEAAYALKLLQSDGRLTHATVAKAVDGRAVTQFHCVEGPVQLFLTSTSQTIDEELLNRCLVLAVDESREQTHAIQQLQRLLQSRSGLEKRREASGLQALHRNAQRLLRPLVVTNDLDATLPFPCERTRHRRDHAKYLSLIQAIALLHQHQRTLHVDESGTESIAVEPSDIALANRLIDKLLKQSNNELPPQSQRCLESLQGFVQSHCQRDRLTPPEFRFTRRSFREQSGWTDNQLRVHFQRLIDLEFLRVHRGRQGCTYLYELVI
ncbi:MAG: hypothetical protein LW720_20895 [Pirellula sp.]|nr:hypothetical protein [Pirellula sp.]